MQNYDPEEAQDNSDDDDDHVETMDPNDCRSMEVKDKFKAQYNEIEIQESLGENIVNMGDHGYRIPFFDIKLHGCPPEENTWEPVSNITRLHYVGYCKRKGLDVPANTESAQVQQMFGTFDVESVM